MHWLRTVIFQPQSPYLPLHSFSLLLLLTLILSNCPWKSAYSPISTPSHLLNAQAALASKAHSYSFFKTLPVARCNGICLTSQHKGSWGRRIAVILRLPWAIEKTMSAISKQSQHHCLSDVSWVHALPLDFNASILCLWWRFIVGLSIFSDCRKTEFFMSKYCTWALYSGSEQIFGKKWMFQECSQK